MIRKTEATQSPGSDFVGVALMVKSSRFAFTLLSGLVLAFLTSDLAGAQTYTDLARPFYLQANEMRESETVQLLEFSEQKKKSFFGIILDFAKLKTAELTVDQLRGVDGLLESIETEIEIKNVAERLDSLTNRYLRMRNFIDQSQVVRVDGVPVPVRLVKAEDLGDLFRQVSAAYFSLIALSANGHHDLVEAEIEKYIVQLFVLLAELGRLHRNTELMTFSSQFFNELSREGELYVQDLLRAKGPLNVEENLRVLDEQLENFFGSDEDLNLTLRDGVNEASWSKSDGIFKIFNPPAPYLHLLNERLLFSRTSDALRMLVSMVSVAVFTLTAGVLSATAGGMLADHIEVANDLQKTFVALPLGIVGGGTAFGISARMFDNFWGARLKKLAALTAMQLQDEIKSCHRLLTPLSKKGPR